MALNERILRLRFHLRRQWQMQPVAFSALGVSMLVVAGAIVTYAHAWTERESVDREWQSLGVHAQRLGRVEKSMYNMPPALPAFRSKHLVEALGRAVEETKLPLDEIQFSLEDNGNQPYLRYRATLTVSSNYSTIRRFLDQLREEVAGISIDTISCARADIGESGLTCDLAVSAFYRGSERG